MAKTIIEKVWDQHVVYEESGKPDLLYIDLHLLHEVKQYVTNQASAAITVYRGEPGRADRQTLSPAIPAPRNRTVEHRLAKADPEQSREIPVRPAMSPDIRCHRGAYYVGAGPDHNKINLLPGGGLAIRAVIPANLRPATRMSFGHLQHSRAGPGAARPRRPARASAATKPSWAAARRRSRGAARAKHKDCPAATPNPAAAAAAGGLLAGPDQRALGGAAARQPLWPRRWCCRSRRKRSSRKTSGRPAPLIASAKSDAAAASAPPTSGSGNRMKNIVSTAVTTQHRLEPRARSAGRTRRSARRNT